MRKIVYRLLSYTVVLSVAIFTLGGSRVVLATNLQKEADSVIALLPTLHGIERLDAITHICDLAYVLGDASFEQLWLEELILAADKNKDYKLSGYAALSLLISFYNYDMFDKLETRFDEIQAYQLKHGNLNLYYSGWSLKVFRVLAEQEYYKALTELDKMQQDAIERKSAYGKGLAECALGQLYCDGWHDTERALETYHNALVGLATQDYVSGTELGAYYDYCSLLLYEKRYEEARVAAQAWLERIAKAVQRRKAMKDINTTNASYAYYYAFMTLLEVKENNREKALEYFSLFEKHLTKNSSGIDYIFYDTYEVYYSYVGMWDSALVYNNKRLEYFRTLDNPTELLPALVTHARILCQKHDFFTATHCYRDYIEKRDSLEVAQNRLLLEEFSEAHKLNQLQASQKQFRNYLLFSLVLLALMSGIGVQVFAYSHRLRRKKSVLYSAIQQSLSQRMTATLEDLTNNITTEPNEHTVSEVRSQMIYSVLEYLMQERELFKISDLTSRDLVQMLGIKRINLIEAIRKATDGKTLKAYINQYRLRYAAQLVLCTPRLEIANIASQAGFRSRLSFLRLFRKEFRTSPSQYRAEHSRGNK